MPRFSRDGNFGSPQRRPKQRPGPAGYPPQRIEPRQFRDQPTSRPQKPAARPPGRARIDPRKPMSGKERRRMLKAAAWRLARIIHVRPAEVILKLAAEPKLEALLGGRGIIERRGEAARLAAKIRRLSAR